MTHPPPHSPARPQPQRGPLWWRRSDPVTRVIVVVATALAPVIIGGVLLITMVSRSADRGEAVDVSLTGCTFTGSTATVAFTVVNNGSRDQTVRLRWEYRDASGARVDTDSTRVEVPAGDTVRDEESTILNADASSGTCRLLSVDR